MLELARKLGLDPTTLDTIAYILQCGDRWDKAAVAIELVRVQLRNKHLQECKCVFLLEKRKNYYERF